MRQAADMPLTGKRVVVTRARAQSAALCERITQLGGDAYTFPTIRIVPPSSYEQLDKAISCLGDFQWVVFTSVNAVDHFFRRMRVLPQADFRQLAHVSIAATGPKTAAALEEKKLEVDVFPGEYRAEALLSALRKRVVKGQRILLPRANIARSVLPNGLRALGCEVVAVDAYQTEIATENAAEVVHMLVDGAIDIITFTSSSTVRNFVKALDQTGEPWRDWISQAKTAFIGPLAANTARELGLEPDAVATDYTLDGLLVAIRNII